jgi:acetylornithine deacetylase
MNVAIGHKGSRAYHARFHGREAHSSLAPTTVNAVEYAADLVVRLRELGRRFAEGGPFDNDYDVTHTTVHSGVIHGGRQVNIVPALCELDFEFRPLPEQDDDAVEAEIRQWVDGELAPEMTAVQPGCGIDLQRRYAYPGLSTAPEEDIVAFAGELSGRTIPIKVAFGTEAGAFRNGLGIPAVVCGPGSIRQAHQPDEFISAEQLAACDAFMLRLLDRMKTS